MVDHGNTGKGIIAYITSDKTHHLGGMPLSLLASDHAESLEVATAIAKIFNANIVQLPTGDYLIIK